MSRDNPTPEESAARIEAQNAAAVEEHRLWWAETTAATALGLSYGDRAKAIALLQSAIAELDLLPERDA